jgi:hypothetical protein
MLSYEKLVVLLFRSVNEFLTAPLQFQASDSDRDRGKLTVVSKELPQAPVPELWVVWAPLKSVRT